MLSEYAIQEILNFLNGQIKSCEMIINGETKSVPITKVEVKGNLLTVYTNTTEGQGTVSDMILKNADGEVILSRPQTTIKNAINGLVSTFYIRLVEEENSSLINIFDVVRGAKNGE